MKRMILKENPLINQIVKFARRKKVKLYLVGGYLRDIYLKRQKNNPDIDFTIKMSSIDFARKLAKSLKSGFVVLDSEHGCARLVKKIKDQTYTLDFSDFRGKDLKEDLFLRDFTLNTLAIDLEKKDQLIDYYSGLKDLRSRRLRVINKRSFDDDPLRILRAFSLASLFNLSIDQQTLDLIRRKKNKLKTVSFERIREELFKILGNKDAFSYFKRMDKLNILSLLMPEIEAMRNLNQGPYHHLDIWQHSLETLRQLEKLIREVRKNKEIREYLEREVSYGRNRQGLIKLAALLHDVGKPKALRRKGRKIMFHGHERKGMYIAEEIFRRLKLSNDEIQLLNKIILFHLRPGYLADIEEISQRAVFRYFRDTRDEAISTLLISIADQRSTKGRLTTDDSRKRHERVSFGLIKECLRRKKQKPLVRLINGDDLIKRFKLEPSPLIGKILSEIEELQAIGKIKAKREGLKAAADIIRKNKN